MKNLLATYFKRPITFASFFFVLATTPLASFANTADWGLVQRFKAQHELATKGNVKAMYDVGKLFERGRGVDKNMSTAAEWFQKAADANHASAQARLGVMYFEGRGVKKNNKKALKLITNAAKKNIASAQFQLGNMYELGSIVQKNLQTAVSWYKKADQNGYYLAKSKAKNLQQLLSAVKRKEESKNTPATVVAAKVKVKPKSKSSSSLLNIIRNGRWFKRKKPTGYLPSAISTCADQKYNSLQCISTSQERDTGAEVVIYNTESTVSVKNKTDFEVVYSNNVLEVSTYAAQDGDGVRADAAESRIKTGGKAKKRTLKCKLINKHLASCSKGSNLPFDLVSP